ncbi:MAG TPA: tetratricopeptide repeat protein [Pyrinomonadaceae bacterium]|nr:tetratricopeptide repeat protein [Pyrinomonadaceae bacterium]
MQELAVEGTLTPDERALLRCRLAKRLEYSGEYEAAGEMLRPFWRGVGESPEVTGLEKVAAAEVLLRAGVLTGWLGSKAKSAGSQETAKDLISQSLSLFEESSSADKAGEARVELAYCYFREGALSEARVLLQEALKVLGGNAEVTTLALLRLAMVEGAATKFNDSLKILIDAAPLFEASENHSVKGSYHNQLAYSLQSLGTEENRSDYFDRAIVEFTAASYHFEQSGHTRYLAHVENNLGLLLHSLDRFEEAHEHLDRARTLFISLGDNVYAAQVDETRAQVLLEQGNLAGAEEVARQACQFFERINALNLLAEALTTRGKALARLGRASEARVEWERAAASAEQAGSLEIAGLAVLTLCEELGHILGPGELRDAYARADQLLAGSQSPEILARLRHVARRALTSLSIREESGGRVAKSVTAEIDSPGAELSEVETLIGEALREHQKQVTFTPEAIQAIKRLFLADGMPSLTDLIRQSVAAAQSGTVVSAEEVEIVAMRSRPPRGSFTQPWDEFSLKEELGRLEKRFIELALKAAGGKISVAARLLGLKHNEILTSIIKSRYPELLAARTPPIPRRRSIIRKPQR